ncbi:MAG TPA: ABC transporter substrate-binding protein [Streptosporangiaceae bacterium]|nr:ABC transporter substrate-binding protein [Streptosporangiaceae bacterium]
MRRIALAVATAATLVATACGGGDSGSTRSAPTQGELKPGEPIKIGMIATLTGRYAALGAGDRQGVQVVTDRINAAGGIKGHKIELIIKDDRTEPNQSVVAFNQLLSENVIAVYGSANANAALAVGPLAQRAKIPYMSLTPSRQLVQPVKRYLFSLPPTSTLWAKKDMEWMQAEGIKKVAVVYASDDTFHVDGNNDVKKYAKDYGLEVVASEPIQTTATDFTSVLAKVRSSGAQAMFLWVAGPAAVIMTKQFAAAKLGDTKLVMTGAQASTLYTQPAGAAANGAVVNGYNAVIGDYLPPGPQKTSYDRLAAEIKAKYNTTPAQFTCDAASGAELLYEAMKRAPKLTRESITDALNNLSLLVPSGRYTYTPTNHEGAVIQNIAVFEVRNGKFVPTKWQEKQWGSLPT